MPRQKLQKIQDRTYAFRIESNQKSLLDAKVERLRNSFNNRNPENRYKVTKNDVVIAALLKGLKSLEVGDLPSRRKRIL